MTAFDLFQQATCQIAEGARAAAIKSLDKAIEKIDANGVDAELRPDLVDLRDSLKVTARSPPFSSTTAEATSDFPALTRGRKPATPAATLGRGPPWHTPLANDGASFGLVSRFT